MVSARDAAGVHGEGEEQLAISLRRVGAPVLYLVRGIRTSFARHRRHGAHGIGELGEEHARVVASLDLGRGLGSVARGVRRASPVVQGCARNRHPRTHGSRVRVRVDDVRHDQGDEKVVNEYSIFCV